MRTKASRSQVLVCRFSEKKREKKQSSQIMDLQRINRGSVYLVACLTKNSRSQGANTAPTLATYIGR